MIQRIGRKLREKYSVIKEPAIYLRDKFADRDDEYILERENIINGVGNAKCADLGGGGNCTLTGMYNIMLYYRQLGYTRIPEDNEVLYGIIKASAQELGFKNKGLTVTKNNDFVNRVWKKGFGYTSGKGRSRYLWRHSRLIKEIDEGRPFLFSLASGVYFNHTVAVCGYQVYRNIRTGKKYMFLIIANAWTNQRRYMAFTHTGAKYISCATFVVPPFEK